MVRMEHVKKYYGSGENIVRALDGVSFSVEKGTFTAVTGPSGSGKSTLLHLMGGLDSPTSGEVVIGGKSISRMSSEELTVFRRRHIGFVFQNYNLIPVFNVIENILFPLRLDKREPDEKYIDAVLRFLGIRGKIHALPGQLSGGQQQRVAIARALAAKPDIILADEPTGNLDSANSAEVIQLLSMGCRKTGQTIVMITHNEKIASLADAAVSIQDGRIQDSRA
ncbi:MAG: ABC transporter ATP-binding protein [Eubacterium sp.]|nr:ABC transporter ATP-binding protein [Eubacterium sp.]